MRYYQGFKFFKVCEACQSAIVMVIWRGLYCSQRRYVLRSSSDLLPIRGPLHKNYIKFGQALGGTPFYAD